MALVRARDVTVAFGDRAVLDGASFVIEPAARTALVGRNGEGKSTLLKLVAGRLEPDGGEIVRRSGLKSAYLPQSVPGDLAGSVYEVVAEGLPEAGRLLADHHRLAREGEDMTALARLQDRLDAIDGWSLAQRVEQTLSRSALSPEADVASLSGGLKRRVLLARALVDDPDLLLLDEPTNHLDMGAIERLVEQLAGLRCALVLVTHDRAFLDAVARDILELDRGRLTAWPGDWATYRARKAEQLEVEAAQNALFDKKLAQEEAWIRQGIKARRTRNEGRVRALHALRQEHRERRERGGSARMSVNRAEKSGKLVFEATGVTFRRGARTVVRDLDVRLERRDRLGIIGPNGCGKSTLVELLVGDLEPDAGTVRHGTRLEIAYFDQLRGTLDPAKSAAENVAGGRDTVLVNGAERHIMSYMQDFLFAPARARAPITALSGGETGRLMLAKLFLKPSNVIVLDEPSNDLDIETLELLEALLADYPGTVILISHDRQLLENVVTRSLVYQGDGRFVGVIGAWDDFERERAASKVLKPVFGMDEDARFGLAEPGGDRARDDAAPDTADGGGDAASGARKAVKLGYKLQRELDGLPATIERLERDVAALQSAMGEPDFYRDRAKADAAIAETSEAQRELDAAYARWDELETLKDGGG